MILFKTGLFYQPSYLHPVLDYAKETVVASFNMLLQPNEIVFFTGVVRVYGVYRKPSQREYSSMQTVLTGTKLS